MSNPHTEAEIAALLSAPFDPSELKHKPAMVKGERALVLTYVDARVIQDRLDDVLGPMGWQDLYECLPDGSVTCRLQIRINGEWITKMDVGGQSEQPDEGDRRKAAFSDALKRAAVKFGIGRYLYRLPQSWCDYDPVKKQIKKLPVLPDFAKPQPAARQAAAPPPVAPASAPPSAPSAAPANGAQKNGAVKREPDPQTGPELVAWIGKVEKWLYARGLPGARVQVGVDRQTRHLENVPLKDWTPADVAAGLAGGREMLVPLTKAYQQITPEQLAHLTTTLEKKRRRWCDVVRFFTLHESADIKLIDQAVYQDTMQRLTQEPDTANAAAQ